MLPVFCLRLAFGALAALLLLSSSRVNPRFFRTHFLTVLGLGALAAVFVWPAGGWPLGALAAAMGLAFLGSVSWSVEGTPGGRALIVLAALAFGAALFALPAGSRLNGVWRAADDLTSAALLGTALTAMLLGHSYLIAPNMSLTPLFRLLAALFAALALRMAVAGAALGFWTATHSLGKVTDVTVLWLPLRWALGFLLPLALAVMAWRTTRLRNTQSTTGILYIVVVFCFLGELTGQLLLSVTGQLV